ncbi:MAG: thiolase family protein [Caldilineaceae bacterium]|nr:thiolase family protein [Caldilineaceae bacterium]
MQQTYIVAATRTPIGKFGGAFVDTSPVELAAHAMQAVLTRAGIGGDLLDLYIVGNILKHGHGQLLPRQAALAAGIPENVDGYAVDMLCSSGMMAVMNGDLAIRGGEAEIVMAGGVESMSQAGFFISHKARWGYKLRMGGPEEMRDLLLDDGLRDPINKELMGEETERLAQTHEVTRDELDEVACASQQRAAAATVNGKFAAEITPITLTLRGKPVEVSQDEGIRADTTMETLAKLRPAFGKEGILTAGNSSQLSDGAAMLLLASERAVEQQGLKPIARILGSSWHAVTPWRFVEGPIPAVQKLVDKLGMQVSDFDLFENNEAFALNNLLFQQSLGLSADRLNIYGGGIALGHPIGASGARILVTLLHALRQEGARRGIASLCHGLGGGTAVAVELV